MKSIAQIRTLITAGAPAAATLRALTSAYPTPAVITLHGGYIVAGDWIKIRCALPDDPAVFTIAQLTGLTPEHVVGALIRFWVWADAHVSRNGHAQNVTLSHVDAVARHAGFGAALIEVGWLADFTGRIEIPNWDRHNGNSAKERCLAADRQRKSRHARSVTEAQPEKRREEKRVKPPTAPQGGPCGGNGEQPGTQLDMPGQPIEPKGKPKPTFSDSDIEKIYAAYPLKRGRGDAVKAIGKALVRIAAKGVVSDPVVALLERVQAFAGVRANQQPQFTPHCATWMNGGRFNDPPSSWLDRSDPNFSVEG